MQLDALLNSIEKYIDRDSLYRVCVIYNTSSLEYEEGYQMLKEHYDYVFLKERYLKDRMYPLSCYLSLFNWKKIIRNPKVRQQHTNFRELTLQCLSNAEAELTMFLTDDSVFVEPVKLSDKWLQMVYNNPDKMQLSLRLGKKFDNQPIDGKDVEGLLCWNYSKNPMNTNWGYRFSVDAHLYQTNELRKVLGKCIFTNPSFLEGIIQDYATRHHLWAEGRSLVEPCILSYPLNMVQEVQKNESQNVSPQMMNSYFLKGYKISYPVPNQKTTFQQYPQYVDFINMQSEQKKHINLSEPTY